MEIAAYANEATGRLGRRGVVSRSHLDLSGRRTAESQD
jgi:hypothetical protein